MQAGGGVPHCAGPHSAAPGLAGCIDCDELADEEAFFKEGSDDDDPSSLQSVRDTPSPVQHNGSGPPQRPLVDYGDDEDEDEPARAQQRFLAGAASPWQVRCWAKPAVTKGTAIPTRPACCHH